MPSRSSSPADEDEAALALLAVLPAALVVALDDHVHALHHVAPGLVAKARGCPSCAGCSDPAPASAGGSRERTWPGRARRCAARSSPPSRRAPARACRRRARDGGRDRGRGRSPRAGVAVVPCAWPSSAREARDRVAARAAGRTRRGRGSGRGRSPSARSGGSRRTGSPPGSPPRPAPSSSDDTRSVLFRSTTSAKAIWSSASRLSFMRSGRCLASTTVTTASSRVRARTPSSMRKVCATGTGSARPVVSMTIASKRPGLAQQPLEHLDQVAAHGAADAAVVHLVDLFVGLDDQVVVDADLAELVDDDREAQAVARR